MTDRSTDGVSKDSGGEEQPREPQSSAPPHLPHDPENFELHSRHHPSPDSDPHKLQLQQGELRHQSLPTASGPGNFTGAGSSATSEDRHQNQTSDFLDSDTPSQPCEPRQPSEKQPSPSESESPPAVAPLRPFNTTASTDPHLAPSSSTIPSTEQRTISHSPTPRIADRDHIRSVASGEPSPASSGTATPTGQHRRRFRSIRPLVRAIMALEKSRRFSTGTSVHRKRQMSTLVEKEGHYGPALTVC
jgi:hypothetical protein